MPRPRTCKPPRTVTVRGHWRQVRKTRKKKRAPRAGPYWQAVSSKGRTCGHRHSTSRGAYRCAARLGREARMYYARHKTRANKGMRVERWDVDRRG